MFLIHDIRESKVYQEAKAEGVEEERQRAFQEKLRAIAIMAARKMSVQDIAEILDLDVDVVRKELTRQQSAS